MLTIPAVAERLSDVVMLFDSQLVCRWVSPSVRRRFGYQPHALVGAALPLVHDDDTGRVRAALRDVLEGSEEATESRVRVTSRRGGTRWVNVTVLPLPEADPADARAVAVMRDVTEQVDLARRLARARAATGASTPDASSSARTARELRAEEVLLAEHERLTSLLQATIEPFVRIVAERDDAGTIVGFTIDEVNDAACQYFGRRREQLIGGPLDQVVGAERRAEILPRYARVVESGEPLVQEEVPFSDSAQGRVRRFDIHAGKDGDGVALTWREVTDQFEAARALAASQQDFRLLAESIGDVVRIIDTSGIHTWVSPSVTTLLGYAPGDLIGTYAQEIIHPDDLARALRVGIGVSLEQGSVTPPRRTRLRHADGHWVWTETTNSFAYDDEGNVSRIYAVTRDAEPWVRAEADLQRMAATDPLTGLLNRSRILEHLTELAAFPAGPGGHTAVLFCDLDNLKIVNDSLGHGAGDAVITTAARRAAGQLNADDLIARFGGDELLVVLPRVRDLAHAQAVAERIRSAIAEPMRLPGSDAEMPGSASIGATLLRPDETADDVISRADAAMYQAKTSGRNTVVVLE